MGNLATPKSVQKLQTALHAKAKAEAGYRFYALYDKIGIFLVMGLATYVLAREAKKASKESEASGGPVEEDLYAGEIRTREEALTRARELAGS